MVLAMRARALHGALLLWSAVAAVDLDWLAACVLTNTKSQLGEEAVLIPTLVHAARGRPGVFVEIGAFTGIALSNTYALEKCFNWTGVLIEANPKKCAQWSSSACVCCPGCDISVWGGCSGEPRLFSTA